MPEYSIKLNLPWTCEQLFDIAADIERYPEFLPGWKSVTVLRRSANFMQVKQSLGLGPINKSFISEATLDRSSAVNVVSKDGPFHHLNINWAFAEVDDDGCQVMLSIEYAMKRNLMEQMSRLFFQRLTEDVVERFRKRAQQQYRVA